MAESPTDLPVMEFASERAWERWLTKNHARSAGIWMRFRKKNATKASVVYSDALDVALCYGWIDGQARPLDEDSYLQRFTPRRSRSRWSKLNVGRVERLMKANRMQDAGQREVDRARGDGRWDAAYAPPSERTVPDDFLKALAKNRKAREFFATLDRRNTYAISYRLEDAKKPETRERRIRLFVEKLERGERIV